MLRAVLGFCLFGPNPDLSWPKSQYRLSLGIKVGFAKGQLISKVFLGFFNSPKKRTKKFCPSRPGQKLKISSSFFGRIEGTKISFQD